MRTLPAHSIVPFRYLFSGAVKRADFDDVRIVRSMIVFGDAESVIARMIASISRLMLRKSERRVHRMVQRSLFSDYETIGCTIISRSQITNVRIKHGAAGLPLN